ncbi:MAG: AAA family ATPase [Pseudomonadota bacterium]
MHDHATRQNEAKEGEAAFGESFVPEFARDGGPTTREVVLLFADISGFSAMSADLVARDTRGAETIAALLNAVYETLFPVIRSHGGSVASLAGDALIALWPRDTRDNTREAAEHCAEALLQALHGAHPDLDLKVLLDTGGLRIDRRTGRDGEDVYALLAGPIIARLPQAAADLGPGISYGLGWHAPAPRAVSEIEESLVSDPAPTRQGNLLQELLSLPSANWMAEFRAVTIVFARLGDPDAFGTGAQLGAALAAIEAQDGAVVQCQSDDKGLVLLAAWGLPRNTFENNAERAVLTATALADLNPALRVGVSSGNVLACILGNRDYRQYSVISEAVNRSASLTAPVLEAQMGARVLLDAATARAVEGRFDLRELGQQRLKGEAAASMIYAPGAERRRQQAFDETFVGREAVTANLVAGLTQPGALLQVIGPAGMGKSHLRHVTVSGLRKAGTPVLIGAADALRRATDYRAWQAIFAELAPGEEDLAAVLHARNLNAAYLSLLSPILGIAQNHHEEVAEEVSALAATGRAALTRELAVALLERCLPQGPAVLVLDDVQWLDSASWLLLAEARRAIPRLAALILSRPVEQADLSPAALSVLDEVTGEPRVLGPLTREDIGKLVARIWQVEACPRVALDRIHDLAEGHPLYSKELAQYLRQEGFVRVEGGHAHIPRDKVDLSRVDLPEGLSGVVAARISALSPRRQLTLKVASVLGRAIDAEVLARIHPEGDGALMGDLAAIEAAGLIERDRQGDLRFHHALITDTAYDLLLTEQRQSLHRQAAEALEGEAGGTAGLMAYHWDRGAEPQRALAHYLEAAETAAAVQADAEVVGLMGRALELAGAVAEPLDDSAIARAHATMAQAYRSLGNQLAAQTHLRAVLSRLATPPPEGKLAIIVDVLRQYLRLRRPARRAPEADEPDLILAARAHMLASEIAYDQQNTLAVLHGAFSGAVLARRGPQVSDVRANANGQLAMTSLYMPALLDGPAYQRAAIETSRRVRDPATRSWVIMLAGSYAFARGQWDEARVLNHEALSAAEAARERKNWEYAAANLANINRLAGQFRISQDYARRVYESGDDRGIPQVKLWGSTGLIKNLCIFGAFDEMEDWLGRARALLADKLNEQNAASSNSIAVALFGAILDLTRGEDAAALDKLSQTQSLYAALASPQVYMVDPLSYILDAIEALRRRDVPADRLEPLLAFMVKKTRAIAKTYPTAAPRLALAQGDLARLNGKAQAARRHYTQAEQSAGALVMPFDQAMARARLSAEPGLSDQERQDHRDAMQAHLTALGLSEPALWSL